MLFFCTWADRASLLVDGNDDVHARAIATEVAAGEGPSKLVPLLPGAFVAEVAFEDDDDDDESAVLVIEALPHVAELLDRLDAAADDDDVTPPAGNVIALVPPSADCGACADTDGGVVVFCKRGAHDDGVHRATTADGEVVEWSDDVNAAAL